MRKRNGVQGLRGVRMFHGLCPFWRAFYRRLLARRAEWRPPAHAYGAVQGRRQETPMAASRARVARLAATRRHDLANAFPSTGHDWIAATLDNDVHPADLPLVRQRREWSVAIVKVIDGDLDVLMGAGGRMGCACAVQDLLVCFARCVVDWQLGMCIARGRFVAKCPVTGAHAEASMFSFVDDLLKVHIIPEPTADAAARVVEQAHLLLNGAL